MAAGDPAAHAPRMRRRTPRPGTAAPAPVHRVGSAAAAKAQSRAAASGRRSATLAACLPICWTSSCGWRSSRLRSRRAPAVRTAWFVLGCTLSARAASSQAAHLPMRPLLSTQRLTRQVHVRRSAANPVTREHRQRQARAVPERLRGHRLFHVLAKPTRVPGMASIKTPGVVIRNA